MRTAILVAVAALTAGAGTAYAGGLTYGSTPPVCASHAIPNEPHHTGTVFSELYHGVFGQPRNGAAVANKAADQNTTQAKRG
jgi:hypothetical protein